MSRFRNLTDSYKLSKTTWICSKCDYRRNDLGKIKNKDRECHVCKNKKFLKFDSKKEIKRYYILRILERNKKISNLENQVPFYFYVKEKRIFTYIADFVYIKDGKEVIEDVKPSSNQAISAVFKIKKKIIEATYGIKIDIIK